MLTPKMNMKIRLFIAFIFLQLPLLASANVITVSDAWIRSAPPNAPVLGAFMQLRNNSNSDVKLISANAQGYGRVEIHQSSEDNGVMRMQKQDFAPVAAHQSLNFKPGGWHIMLIRPTKVPTTGAHVPIQLTFDNAPLQTIDFVVKQSNVKTHHHH